MSEYPHDIMKRDGKNRIIKVLILKISALVDLVTLVVTVVTDLIKQTLLDH